MKPTGYARSKHSLSLELYTAVEEQNLQDVFTLLECDGADPNMVLLEKGISPFHLVVGSESYQFAEEATRVFLQHNGNPNVLSEDGLTPLHVAAVWGRTGLLLLLLLCGGDPWIRDCESSLTPLHLALKEKHWEAALVLQRHQLLCRRNRRSNTTKTPRYHISLEKVHVNAGVMQAEYVATHDNIYPVLMPPVPHIEKRTTPFQWNIDPLQTEDYVQQWCDKEFPAHPATSTPTRPAPPAPSNTANFENVMPFQSFSPKTDNYCSNMLCSNQMTPSDVKCGAAFSPGQTAANTQKSFVKNAGDTRKKLFLELKKRITGLKNTFDNSKNDIGREKEHSPKTSSYFSWKKKKSNENKNIDSQMLNEENCNLYSCIDKIPHNIIEQKEKVNVDFAPTYYNFKENVDEVDAVPLYGQADVSMEWIASQSCFTERGSPNSTNSQLYVTCDEGSVIERNAAKIRSDTPSSHTGHSNALNSVAEECVFKIPERPPRRKQLATSISSPKKAETISETNSIPSFGCIVSEEYKYQDDEAGVVLYESHVLSKPIDVPCLTDSGSVASVPISGVSDTATSVSEVSSVPASFTYNSEVLRSKLIALGEIVGPITSTTKQVYLRRLHKLQKQKCQPQQCKISATPYTLELQKTLMNVDWEHELMAFCKLEADMCAPFQIPDPGRRWREGVSKSSFNYLLLDPRISLNLPANVVDCDASTWHQFISSLFYVGKGKRSRPYSHLYEAARLWKKGVILPNSNPKMKRIHDIWNDGYGVVCLHIFLNIIPVEAFTREAAIIDALGIVNICNLKLGEYYGPAATWRTRQKRQLGCYLLYRAMKIFLNEGERQLRPSDIE